MSELECIICCHPFNSGINLPRILQCGHTICAQCLVTILESSKTCPTCRQETTSGTVNFYVVNYSVLNICESNNENLHSKENFIQVYQKKLEKRQEEHQELRATLESLKDNIDLNLGLVKSNEEQLTSLLEACDPFNRNSGILIKEVDERIDTIRSQVQLCSSHLISNVSLKSGDFTSTDQYLQKIHEMVVAENKKVVAVLRIDGVSQGAKLSFSDDFLFISAFERSQELNDNSTTLCFQDLLTALQGSGKAKSILGFLDLYYRADSFSKRVLVEMEHSNSSLCSQFLKLCTGETGVSYKGREYNQLYGGTTSLEYGDAMSTDWIIRLQDISWTKKEVNNFYEQFLKKSDNLIECSLNRCYASLNLNGSFEIFQFNADNIYGFHLQFVNCANVIGTIVDEKNDFDSTFKDASHRKIANCGIAVKF